MAWDVCAKSSIVSFISLIHYYAINDWTTMIDPDADATNVAGEERSSHVNVHIAEDQKLLTIPHIIPSRSPRECQRGTKLCLKGKAMRVQIGSLEMLCFVSGARKKKVDYAARRAACTGGIVLVWMRCVFPGIPLANRPTNCSHGLSRRLSLVSSTT